MTEYQELWAIDLEWYATNHRSLTVLARDTLCVKCRKKLRIDQEEIKASDILKSVKNCCAKSADFITPTLPLQETAFRVFLANGNQPLTLDELGRQMSERRGIDAYRTSPEMLLRLLRNDQHYGLRPVTK